ncbi:hypothetical protein CHS0354_018663 [Potamilus streckersoni]|uniref:Uncharacterized protein n=1 Tax=Potamilus streckersoni TaxID=2493646 RepID=A0AAE0SL64_9BIVA|nr:hypothetical protein CHS0354_018663 [Potamilus streckersoni]
MYITLYAVRDKVLKQQYVSADFEQSLWKRCENGYETGAGKAAHNPSQHTAVDLNPTLAIIKI